MNLFWLHVAAIVQGGVLLVLALHHLLLMESVQRNPQNWYWKLPWNTWQILSYLAAAGVVRTGASILITLLAVAPLSSLYCVVLHCVPPGRHCLLVFSSGLGHTPHSPYTFNGNGALKKLHPGGKEVRTTFGAVTFIGQVLPLQLKKSLILHCSFQSK